MNNPNFAFECDLYVQFGVLCQLGEKVFIFLLGIFLDTS